MLLEKDCASQILMPPGSLGDLVKMYTRIQILWVGPKNLHFYPVPKDSCWFHRQAKNHPEQGGRERSNRVLSKASGFQTQR